MNYCVYIIMGGIMQCFYVGNVMQCLNKWCQYCVVVDQFVIQFQLFMQVKDSCFVVVECIAYQQYIVCGQCLCVLVNICWNCVYVSGVDKQFIYCVVLYYFSIVSNDGNVCCVGGFCYVGYYGFQCFYW